MTVLTRALTLVLFLAGVAACTGAPQAENPAATTAVTSSKPPQATGQEQGLETISNVCPRTEPTWAKHPEDSAVGDPPSFGYYFLNEDRSIWASAWWTGQDGSHLRAGDEGVKVGWFRPAGADLEITGHRIDAQAPPLEAHVPCCYPTRFQASGLHFPTEGCWRVTARAADSELAFVVWVAP